MEPEIVEISSCEDQAEYKCRRQKESCKAEVRMQDCHWGLYMEEFAREK